MSHKKTFFSTVEVMIASAIVAIAGIPILVPFHLLINKKFEILERIELRSLSEAVWFDVLRMEFLSKNLNWVMFNSQNHEHAFELSDQKIVFHDNITRTYRVVIAFKRVFQTPRKQSDFPWKRGVIAKMSFFRKGRAECLLDLERLLVLEKLDRLGQSTLDA